MNLSAQFPVLARETLVATLFDMQEFEHISDLTTVVENNAEPSKVFSAITKLRESRLADARAIAAQGCVQNPLPKWIWLKRWLEVETSEEVRGWLYIALANNSPIRSKKYLDMIYRSKGHMSDIETIYLLCALSVSHGSRLFLLKLLSFVFSLNPEVSREAARLSKMLVDEDDVITMKFIEVLEREASVGQSNVS